MEGHMPQIPLHALLAMIQRFSPMEVADTAQATWEIYDYIKANPKVVESMTIREGEICVDNVRFEVQFGRNRPIGERRMNSNCSVQLVQQSPHWIVQVSREAYVWKATLQLFVYLRDLFRPTTVHFDLDALAIHTFGVLLLHDKIRGGYSLRLLHASGTEYHPGDLRFVLKNVEGVQVVTYRPHAMPPMDLLANFYCVYLPNVCTWITWDHICSMNCRFLEIGKGNQNRSIFREGLKILANYWVASDELMSWKAFFFHDIEDHDDGLAWDRKRRPRHIQYTDPRTGRQYNIDAEEGWDYVRDDGTIATVVKWNADGSRSIWPWDDDVDITGGLFYVWDECEILGVECKCKNYSNWK
ncbi:hypothetical protein CRE_04277 [Caenorhabditis remanei]|uniref:F-box associated domain-containing protein n=1 Tax=Caenorhabditis remanei TaxID=31234 RepID=E3NAS7_CAERE|nr:hypothetical protein CRE_04277 [Caenorhabditis remanei]